MTGVAALLPTNTQPFERALAAAMSDSLPVPLAEALDPARTPAALLPWLAVHEGVQLWFSDWTDERKRHVIGDWPLAAWTIGTRAGAHRMLSYVDGTLVDAIAYPARFVVGRAVMGRTPIGHPPHLARYLVRVRTYAPPRGFTMRRGVLGRRHIREPDREPLRRCLAALRIAKGPETEYRVDFGHWRRLSIADAPPLDAGFRLDQFVVRSKL